MNDAVIALRVLAVDPVGIGGVRLRAQAGPVRDAWLRLLQSSLPPDAPWQRLPGLVTEDGLLGGLDLTATLQRGELVLHPGVLAQADGGLVVMTMAERCETGAAACIAQALDNGAIPAGRAPMTHRPAARFGVVALDEARADDDRVMSAALAERLGLDVRLEETRVLLETLGQDGAGESLRVDVERARRLLSSVVVQDDVVAALCEGAMLLGIVSLRAPWFALRVARILAALAGHATVDASDAAVAARLVLGPRARGVPPSLPSSDEPADPTDGSDADSPPSESASRDRPASAGDASQDSAASLEETIEEAAVEAATVTLPRALLSSLLTAAHSTREASSAGGRGGGERRAPGRGRRIGSEPGKLIGGRKLDLMATLRAAAPWQALRRRESSRPTGSLLVRSSDLHVHRFRERRPTTTVFVVDASGSQALHRLAETKGAVELLLAECYVRRDEVAVIAFRGSGAELVLAPTRSLLRAKRSLAGLPGGGGTPLASGIGAAHQLACKILRDGGTPQLVLLTDGCANVARDGNGGRAGAMADALRAGRAWAALGVGALLIDSGLRSKPEARAVAEAMQARYLPLPDPDSRALALAIRA